MTEKLAPKDAIRSYCTQCLGLKQFNAEQVKDCEGDQALNGPCAFFPYRLGKRPSVKVFRKFCLDCMCDDREAVRECQTEACSCHPYRFGKNPAKKGQGANLERMKVVRESVKKRQNPFFSGQDIEGVVQI